jgi:hypothetical protein
MRTKGIGPRNLGMSKSPAKMMASPAKKDPPLTPEERAAKLAEVKENSRAMKEERAIIQKRKMGSKLGLTPEQDTVQKRMQEKGLTRDIKK